WQDTTRSRRGCVPPIPAWSPAVHRFQQNQYLVPAWSCPNGGASRVGTNCYTPPCLSPTKLMWRLAYFRDSERSAVFARRMDLRSEGSLFGLVTIPHPAPRPQLP